MRSLSCITLGILMVLSMVSPRPVSADAAADVAAIDALYASWRKAVEGADIPGYVAVLDADVRLLPPDAEAIVGAANYGKFLEPVFAGADYRIEVVRSPVIEVLGDVALAEYDYVIHLKLKNQSEGITQAGALTAERTAARYIDVLRRQADGRWAVYRHAWQNKTR
jgi:ketosteroid isomerase-like protein